MISRTWCDDCAPALRTRGTGIKSRRWYRPTSGRIYGSGLLWGYSIDHQVGPGSVSVLLIGGSRGGFPSLAERLGDVCCFPFCVPDFFVGLYVGNLSAWRRYGSRALERWQLTESETLALSNSCSSSNIFIATKNFLAVPRVAFPARSSESAIPKIFKAKFSI